MRKITLFLLAVVALASCQSQYPDLEDGVYAEFVTNKGTFVAELYVDQTPLTVANFTSLAKGTNGMVDDQYKGKKFYDSLTFHRVIKDFMIQGGDPQGTGSGSPGYKFPDEFVPELRHTKKGLLSMANSGPETNGSQFFITLKETPWLDGKHTIFGEIVVGMEIVDSIGQVKTGRNDKPESPIVMEHVNIIEKGSAKAPNFTKQMEVIEAEKMEKAEKINKIAAAKVKDLNAFKADAQTLESGLMINIHEKGTGVKPEMGSKIKMNYAGYFSDGKLFDSNRLDVAEMYDVVDAARKAANQYVPVPTDYSKDARLIPGFREALLNMEVGDKAVVFIPSHLGYGERGYPPVIPANEDLIFELEIVVVVKE